MSSVERPAIDKLVPERWGIETKKLVLIPPEADQDMAVSKLLSDPETMKYLSFMTKPGGFTQEDAAKRRLYRDEGQIRDKIFVNFSIALKKSQIPPEIQEKILSEEYLPAKQIAIDGGFIDINEPYFIAGVCGLGHIDCRNRSSDAGIILDARFWRSGVSTVALYLTLMYGFETLQLHRIAIETTEMNTGMRGWMEYVLGIKVEGIRKEVLYLGNDTYIDSWDYAIFDRDWSSHVKQRLCARIEKK